MNPLSPTNAAYIAGLVDGEGCIGLYQTIKVEIAITCREILEWLQETVGDGEVKLKRAKIDNWKAAYRWTLNGRTAIEFLRQIYPYLKIKKLQANFAFEYEAVLLQRGANWKVPEDYMVRRREIKAVFDELNGKKFS